MATAPSFDRYIGIDYSGAATPSSSLKGLRVYMADLNASPVELEPPPSPRKYWTRRGVAEWLAEKLGEPQATLVGIDHGFSFPLAYFREHDLPLNWTQFLEDFQYHWPTDEDHMHVEFVRDGISGNAQQRSGNSRWRRLTEVRARGKSVFHFDVQGSVAKSTHAGIPWLLRLRRQTAGRVHFWPFDGWQIPAGKSALVEVYPALWSRSFPLEGRDSHQQDAYSIAAWMRHADRDGALSSFFRPRIEDGERQTAEIEGWILGVN
jgi:hypothetical protein